MPNGDEREAGELVEDGEIDSPVAPSTATASKSKPIMTIGLRGSAASIRGAAARGPQKGVFDEDSRSSVPKSVAAADWGGRKIKGAATDAPASSMPSSSLPPKPVSASSSAAAATNDADQGTFSIKGRGYSAAGASNGTSASDARDSRPSTSTSAEEEAARKSDPRKNGINIAGSASLKAAGSSSSGIQLPASVPSKPKVGLALPFKSISKAAPAGIPTQPASMRNLEEARARERGEARSEALVGRSDSVGSSYSNQLRANGASAHRSDKGKSREAEDGEMDDEAGHEASFRSQAGRRGSRSPDRPYGNTGGAGGAWHDDPPPARHHDDDRRYAGHGGGRADMSYRSPVGYHYSSSSRGGGRYDDRYYGSSARHGDRYMPHQQRGYDDGNQHRSRYDGYDDRSHDHRRPRSRSRSPRDSRRHDDRRERDRDANRWERGSSYSPNGRSYDHDPRSHGSHREPWDRDGPQRSFHDEPGAPRHPSRDLAPKQSAASTPAPPGVPHSLPQRPNFAAEPSAGGRKPEPPKGRPPPPPPPPRPQVATPFFLPTPPTRATAAGAHEAEETAASKAAELDAEMEIDEVSRVLSPSAGVQAAKFTFFGTSALDDYELEEKLGEGTFGVVHKARRKVGSVKSLLPEEAEKRVARACRRRAVARRETECKSKVKEGDVVALKKIVMHNDMDGVPITALREIRILKSLNHPNVVPVVDMAFQPGDYGDLRRGTIYMVFPYMAHDLAGLLENKSIGNIEPAVLKLYARQLLEGTSYLHRNRILHRDMKAANLLISDEGVLQIADFGLARSIEDDRGDVKREYTNCVVTRWYRPPELLLGLKTYGRPIDMWGVGCVIGEMFHKLPVFTGSSDLDQLAKIVHMCGPITDESLPGWRDMPDSKIVQFPPSKRSVAQQFHRFGDEVSDLLDKLLVLDPEARLTADQALDHDWFWTDPLPANVGEVRTFPSSHEYDKRKAHEERAGHGGEKSRAAQEAAFRGPNQVVKVPAAVQPQQQRQPPIPVPPVPLDPIPAALMPASMISQGWGGQQQQSQQRMRPAGALPSAASGWPGMGQPVNVPIPQPNGVHHRPLPNSLPARPTGPSYPQPVSSLPRHPGLPARPGGLPPTPSGPIGEPDLKRRRMGEGISIAGNASRMSTGGRPNGAYADLDAPAGGADPGY